MQYCQYCGAEEAEKYCGVCGRPQGDHKPRSDVDYSAVEQDMKTAGSGGERVLFEGTTWPLGCLSPMCCSSKHWRVSNKRIDLDYSCCRNKTAIVDMRRVKDLAFRRNPLQMMLGRGTVVVFTDADPHKVHISKMGARKLYLELRSEWTNREAGISG